MNITKQASCEQRVDVAKKVLTRLSSDLGFISRGALLENAKRGWLLTLDDCCFVNFRVRKDDQVTIYEIEVLPDSQMSGYGRKLIEIVKLIGLKNRKKMLVAKCPENLRSNGFYRHMGFTLKKVETGRKRRLNVWEMEL